MCKIQKAEDVKKYLWFLEGAWIEDIKSSYSLSNWVVNCHRSLLKCSNANNKVWRHGRCVLGLSLASLEPSPALATSLPPPAGVITSLLTSLLTSPFWKLLHLTSYHLTVLEISNLTTSLLSSPFWKLLHITSYHHLTVLEILNLKTSLLTSPFCKHLHLTTSPFWKYWTLQLHCSPHHSGNISTLPVYHHTFLIWKHLNCKRDIRWSEHCIKS